MMKTALAALAFLGVVASGSAMAGPYDDYGYDGYNRPPAYVYDGYGYPPQPCAYSRCGPPSRVYYPPPPSSYYIRRAPARPVYGEGYGYQNDYAPDYGYRRCKTRSVVVIGENNRPTRQRVQVCK